MGTDRLDPAPSVVILAAGKGTRMRSELPKMLHEAAGVPLLEHVLRAVEPLTPHKVVVVIGYGAEQYRRRFAEHSRRGQLEFVEQRQQLGTGHALLQARGALADVTGTVVVLNGDGPLVRSETIAALVALRGRGPGMALVTCDVSEPDGLGRVVRAASGAVIGIVEHKDASARQLTLREINPGIYAFDSAVFDLCARLGNDNAAGEYYITELLELYLEAGLPVAAHKIADEQEVWAVNDRVELARADRALRDRDRLRWLLAGVTMIAPEQVFLDPDVELGRDVVLHPGVHLLKGTTVGDGATVGPGAVLSGCRVRQGAVVAPLLVASDATL